MLAVPALRLWMQDAARLLTGNMEVFTHVRIRHAIQLKRI
jgi:hypothetical protein